MTEENRTSRRDIIKRAAYLTPAIITLLVAPSFASHGSGTDPSRWTEENSDDDQPKQERDHRKPRWKPWPWW